MEPNISAFLLKGDGRIILDYSKLGSGGVGHIAFLAFIRVEPGVESGS